nr:MAG TPA: hypothetical protein [Caudoviricetes sp.]
MASNFSSISVFLFGLSGGLVPPMQQAYSSA